jgi:hypothetical protein
MIKLILLGVGMIVVLLTGIFYSAWKEYHGTKDRDTDPHE